MISTLKQSHYISALKYNWLTSLYDPLIRWTIQEKKFKAQLVKQSNIKPGQRVLDLGCGTATLTMLVKQVHPESEVIGLDGDERILAIGREKILRSGLDIQLQKGISYEMDFPDDTFDRVFSSLLFHHLTCEQKRRTLAEVHRILKPGGELHIADWGKAQNALMRGVFLLVQLLDGFSTTKDNVQGKLPEYIRKARFKNVEEKQHYHTILGTLTLYRAKKDNRPADFKPAAG
jgi:ubiquinone/menaquinone biosynthesis C-methylase UbiE